MKRLYKSTRDRKVLGVCGGLGEYLGIDPTWIRLVWFFLIWPTWGMPFFIYLFLGIILPSDYTIANGRDQAASRQRMRDEARDRRNHGRNRAADELSDFLRRYQQNDRRQGQDRRRDVTPKDDWSDF